MAIFLKKSSPAISVKWSSSHMTNNLTVYQHSDTYRPTIYGVSHKSGFTMVTVSDDGTKQIQSQVISHITNNDNSSASDASPRLTSYVLQAAFIPLPVRHVLVLACTYSIQIYELDGTNIFIYRLDKYQQNRTELSIYSRGIVGIGQNLLCVGNHQGEIFIFQIPSKGTNVSLRNTIVAHEHGITSLASNASLLISSDTSGVIQIWNMRTISKINTIQSIDESGVTSLSIWNDCIIASYINGIIRIFNLENGEICGLISAHARAINAIDCNDQGILASVSDDCYLRLWKLSGDAENLEISHKCNYRIENNQLVGVKFLNLPQADLAISSYDSSDITILYAA